MCLSDFPESAGTKCDNISPSCTFHDSMLSSRFSSQVPIISLSMFTSISADQRARGMLPKRSTELSNQSSSQTRSHSMSSMVMLSLHYLNLPIPGVGNYLPTKSKMAHPSAVVECMIDLLYTYY